MTATVTESIEASLTFDMALELFDHCDWIAVDTETTTSPHLDDDNDIRDGSGYAQGVSLASRVPSLGIVYGYFPFRHKNGSNLDNAALFKLKEKIENYKGYLIFHNAKFDLVSLQTLGINYTGKFFCTLQIAHLLNEELPYSKSLDACTAHYLKIEGKRKSPEFENFVKNFGWKACPADLMNRYGAYDAYLAYRLMEVLWDKMDDKEKEYWEHKQKFYHVIISMERRGVRVDTELCREMTILGESVMDDIQEILGGRNPGSTKDLYSLLIEELKLPVVKKSKKTGKPSFDKFAMEEYERMLELRDDETARHILEYRGWQKSVSSNYKPYIDLLSADGRLRPNYKLHGTKTGRMSCEKPNLQQIPRNTSKAWNGRMKSAFIPDPGYNLWEADYGQLELRLAAAYGKETVLLEIFEQDRDVFTEMSQQLGMARHATKTLTYTIQYGGGINRISTVFGVSPAVAERIRDDFYTTYPGFRAVNKLAQRQAALKGSLRLWSGRSRHFLYPADESHKAFNSAIQGGAADIVERSMVRLNETGCNNDECRMLLQVHDSVVFEIKDGLGEKYHPMIRNAMEKVEPDFGVRFKVDIHQWGK